LIQPATAIKKSKFDNYPRPRVYSVSNSKGDLTVYNEMDESVSSGQLDSREEIISSVYVS
jgi:hypothetical protein